MFCLQMLQTSVLSFAAHLFSSGWSLWQLIHTLRCTVGPPCEASTSHLKWPLSMASQPAASFQMILQTFTWRS